MVAGVRAKGGKVGVEGDRGRKEKGMESKRGWEQRWWRERNIWWKEGRKGRNG